MLRAAALLIAAALLSPCASALSACRAAVLDADTGEVCFARNASEHALIASTTKIMTGLLIAEDCDPDAVVTVPQEAVGIEGSSLYLKAGEQLTVRSTACCCTPATMPPSRWLWRTAARSGPLWRP